MTSSDVLDTAFSVQLKQASNLLLKDLDVLLDALKKRVEENLECHHDWPQPWHSCRTDKLWYQAGGTLAAFARAKTRLIAARDDVATCAISGPVGTFATVDPRIEIPCRQKNGA